MTKEYSSLVSQSKFFQDCACARVFSFPNSNSIFRDPWRGGRLALGAILGPGLAGRPGALSTWPRAHAQNQLPSCKRAASHVSEHSLRYYYYYTILCFYHALICLRSDTIQTSLMYNLLLLIFPYILYFVFNLSCSLPRFSNVKIS